MKLSARMALTISVAVVVGLAATFALAGTVIVRQFEDAEAAQVEAAMAAVQEQIGHDLDLMAASASAFRQVMAALAAGAGAGAAANASAPVQDGQAELGRALFEAHDIDGLYFILPPAWARLALAGNPQPAEPSLGFDPETGILGIGLDAQGNYTGGDGELADALPGQRFGTLTPLEVERGLLAVRSRVWMLGAVGLSPSDLGVFADSGPGADAILGAPSGLALVVAREMDAAFLARLESETGRSLSIEPLGGGSWPAEEVRLERPSWKRLTARMPIADSEGVPVAVLASPQDRAVFADAVRSIGFFLVATLGIAAFVLATALLVLDRTVTRPIVRLDQRMAHVRASGDLDLRVAPAGGRRPLDEVAELARQFDALLASLQERTRQLEESNRDLQRFASVVSHDLKSPLSTLTLNLAMLLAQAKAAGEGREVERIERMQRGIAAMEERITGILAYSRTRKAEIPLEPVDLGTVLEEVQRDLAAEIQRTGARVAVEPMPTVHGERVQLAQVFQNLLANAIKFGRPGEAPAVRVWAVPSETGWAVHVEDNGRGFDPHELERLFQPFSRLSNAEGVDGHGIGLATCARIMQRLGGRLNAEGVPGKGARFTVLLKAVPPPAA